MAAAVVFKILFLVLIALAFRCQRPAAGETTTTTGATSSKLRANLEEDAATTTEEAEKHQASKMEATDLVMAAGGTTTMGVDQATNQPRQPPPLLRNQQHLEKQEKQQQVNYADLCYLSNGGSSLTLTVNEATQVGAVIGAVEVNGDPSLEGGNVDLTVDGQELKSASPDAAEQPFAKLRRVLGRRWAQPPPEEGGRRVLLAPPLQPTGSENYYSLVASSPPSPIQQQPPPVRLEPGTKNLVLARPLDKEGAEGEQSLVVQVRCSPRLGGAQSQTSMEATTIPVRLLVTDANDHAPEWLGPKPLVVNISETAPPGSQVAGARELQAIDRDSAGPHSTLHYRVLEDPTSSNSAQLLHFPNPLEPTLVLVGQLDYEQQAQFTLTLVAQDQGEPEPLAAQVQLQVNVIDFDDQNPRFMDDKYTLVMDESQQSLVGQNLQVLPRNLYAEDGDRGIQAPVLYSLDHLGGFQSHPTLPSPNQPQAPEASGEDPQIGLHNIEHYLHLNPTSGELRLIRQWPSRWAGPPLTLVVRATQADNKDRYALTTLTIAPTLSTRPAHAPSLIVGQPNKPASTSAPMDELNKRKQGIEFVPDRLNVSVAESVPINEKIGRVRARYLPAQEPPAATATPPSISQEAPVDLVAQAAVASTPGKGKRSREQQQQQLRPINYQILGDQTDQFGINGLGELFVKRPLDYEQRQVYKLRVLATYTKFSDICQVQVNVLNVNDNKPKFTQPQYSFHLSESRLRSNQIGFVQAHDADLNDTLHYSLAGEHAHLFEVSPGGLIGLRADTLKSAGGGQLDSSTCQLLVQATDSLGSGPHHSHQARVTIQVAPQLVGRPLSALLQAVEKASSSQDNSRLFNSRSLLQQGSRQRGSTTGSQPQDLPASASGQQQQRSSLATVFSSLQHMVRGINLLDMPMSSALLLSALLAFLLCLLLILLISMGLHLYRRRSKLRQRHQLAAASRLRHAQLTAALQQPTPSASNGGGGYLAQGASPSSRSRSSSLHSPAHSSPTTISTSAATQAQQRQHPLRFSGHLKQIKRLDAASKNHRRRQETAHSSLVSSQSNQSNQSSYTTDDSSALHCGHYSINSASSKQFNGFLPHPKQLEDTKQLAGLTRHQQVIVAAAANSELGPGGQVVAAVAAVQPNELSVLTSSQPGIKAYRKLPPLGSLVRRKEASPPLLVAAAVDADESETMAVSTATGDRAGSAKSLGGPSQSNSDSAIASDVSQSSSSSQSRLKRLAETPRGDYNADEEEDEDSKRQMGHLMALIRSPERARAAASQLAPLGRLQSPLSPLPQLQPQTPSDSIRWPRDVVPQRVKRLTWDDELSSLADDGDEDCFVAPEIQLGGPISPLSPLSNHQYPIQGTTDTQDHFAEHHFLFSTPCSPALLSSLSPQHQHQPHQRSSIASSEQVAAAMGQENCFDYTIVQSSTHLRLDSLNSNQQHQQQQSLSAQHHLLQQQQQQHQARPNNSYLYSNRPANQQDLKLMTSAVL